MLAALGGAALLGAMACGAAAPPSAHLSATTLDLPPTLCGTTHTTRLDLDNPGGSPLHWDALLEDLPGASVTPASGTLDPGAHIALELSVASPMDKGLVDLRGRLVIRSDAAETARLEVPVAMRTTGAVLRFVTKGLDFGQVPSGATSPPLRLAIANDGDRATDVRVDPKAPFSFTWESGPTAAPGEQAVALARFSPDALGDATGALTLGSGSGVCGVAGPLPLVGRGVDGVVGVTPGSIDFGPVDCGGAAQQSVVIFNTSDAAFDASASRKLGMASRYALAVPDAVVPGKGQVSFPVSVGVPSDQGIGVAPYDDALTIVTTAPKDAPRSVTLATQPAGAMLRFDAAAVDLGKARLDQGPAPVSVMLHNDGNAPAVVGMQLASPMSAPSSVTVAASSTASIAVAPGDWSTLGAPVTRTLQISTAAATCSPTPAGVDLTVRYTDRAKTIAAGGTILATLAESGHVYEQWDTPNLGPVTRVSGLSGLAVEVAAYSFAACARLSTGGVRCWGNNVLGNGSSSSATPVDVTGISTATSLVAQRERVCAVLADGTVRCWGSDGCGCLLGTCPAAFLIATPQQVPNLSNVKRMALAQCHQCALQSNGTAMCWGLNWQGQLGDGTTGPERGTPAPVQMQPAPFTTIAAGAYGTCATDTLGFLWCWGHALPYPQSSSPSPTAIGPLGVLSLQMLDVPDRTLALSSTMLSWWDPAILVRSMPIVAKQVSAWSRLCVVRPDGRVACSPWDDPPVFTDVPGFD